MDNMATERPKEVPKPTTDCEKSENASEDTVMRNEPEFLLKIQELEFSGPQADCFLNAQNSDQT
jgi:hypothetical protein